MLEVPYGAAEFFEVFRAYHASFPLAPLVWTALAATSLLLIYRNVAGSSRLASAILAGLWMWAGIAYHILHFAEINPIARVFGVLFVMQGLFIAGLGVLNPRLAFTPSTSIAGLTGTVLIVYALLLYPLIGLLSGHGYPGGPTLGVPCPTTIFTFGLFLWSMGSLPRHLLVIPVLWAFLAAPAALSWGVIEDIMMPVAALLVIMFAVHERRSRRSQAMAASRHPIRALR
jgi:hypothetical protein